MSTERDFRRIAMALDGTSSAPHFDRVAFKVSRIYATLAADGLTANLKFTPDEQELKCLTAPEAFEPVANAWGKQGWTAVTLKSVNAGELKRALDTAWQHARPGKKRRSISSLPETK
jgi:hypothetical protein